MSDTAAVASPPPSSPPPRRYLRRALRWLAWSVVGAIVLVLALLAALWGWSSSDSSLATTVRQVARWMPAGQALEAEGVTGSLRHGGHIDQLVWRNETLEVKVRDIHIAWGLQLLLERRLYLSKVQIGSVHASATAPSPETGPTKPLEQLQLPLQLHVPFDVQLVQWQPLEGDAFVLGPATGTYVYENTTHVLDLERLHVLDGEYKGRVALDGHAPMNLDAQLQAQLRWSLAEGQRTGSLQAQATAKGTLAGPDARLRVEAQASPSDAPSNATSGLHAKVDAMIAPWQPMPLIEAEATLRDVDAAAFWPSAPQTLLSGQVQAAPQPQGAWSLRTDLRNALPGPADQQRVPVETLRLQAIRDAQGAWEVAQSQIELGGGTLDLQGRFDPALNALQAQGALSAIAPAQLWSTLEASPLSGTLSAQGTTAGPIDFQADIQAPAARGGTGDPLHIRLLQARGQWTPETLQIAELRADALGIQAQGQSLQWTTATQQGEGQLTLQWPGASLEAQGRMAPESGQGQAHLRLQDLQRIAPWVQRLPLPQSVRNDVAALQLRGQGDVRLNWKGGWQSAMRQLQQAGLMDAGLGQGSTDFSLDLQGQIPRLELTPPGGQPLTVRESQLRLQGRIAQLTGQLQGQVQTGTQHVHLQPLGLTTGQNAARVWSIALQPSQVQYRDTSQTRWKQPWQVGWSAPLQVRLQPLRANNPSSGWRIQLAPAQLAVNGPEPGQVEVSWQDTLVELPSQGRLRVQSQGQLRNLSTAWAKAFTPDGKDPLAQNGLGGVLTFDARWDLQLLERWKGVVRVERTSGDLTLQSAGAAPTRTVSVQTSDTQGATAVAATPPSSTAGLQAGIRALWAEIQLDGEQVLGQLRWDSERAGTVRADVNTRMQFASASAFPTLANDAPLQGEISAHLPDVGVWSAFAPPGWRVGGNLKADLRLGGTVQTPQWQGPITSDGLTIRSLLDGIDFRNGRLRAQLDGERLTLQELRVEGVPGVGLRIAGFSGNRTAPPADGGFLTLTGHVDWSGRSASNPSSPELILQMDARLQRLQVQVRADRQVGLSGQLQARLLQGQWTVRGDITADRAAIFMPEASAPKLGQDVVVRTRAQKAAQEAARQAPQSGDPEPTVAPGVPLDLQVRVNLGEDFAVQALGFTSRLKGELQVRNASGTGIEPRVTGEITTEQGRYRAWGQSLDVESGLVRFNGPYDNPSLDILAIRPNIEVRAGVQVTGTASAPRVRLFSEPDLPDAEKLSWIALGRSTANGGAEAAVLQQAALAMLSGDGSGGAGNFAQKFGLDEIGMKGPADGESASNTALTVGKRLSKDLYVTYERSLSGAMGTLYIFYDLSRRLTLRGQTGTTSAIDLIYTKKYD